MMPHKRFIIGRYLFKYSNKYLSAEKTVFIRQFIIDYNQCNILRNHINLNLAIDKLGASIGE